jgi:hypothetical protein
MPSCHALRWGHAIVGLVALAGCGSSPPARQAVNADTGARTPPPGSVVVAGPDGTYELLVPARWTGRYRVDSLSPGERGRGLPGAFVIEYLPADTTVRPQALMALVAYDSATWRAVRAEEGPPPGDSVAAHAGRVYVIGLPQSNPFAPGSPDATSFQHLELRRNELVGLIRFR